MITYEVKIESITESDSFRITWTNVGAQTQDYFEQSRIEITLDDVNRLWLDGRHQPEIGNKLFRFLDGDARLLQRALDEAAGKGEPLLLQLRTCKEVAD